MRVAFVNTTANPRHAPAGIMLAIARAAASRGDAALVIYGRGEHTSEAGIEMQRVGTDAGVLFHAGMSRLIDREGFFSRRAAAAAIRALRIFRPDIVHIHNLHGHYMHFPQLLEYLDRERIPVVMTLHDLWPLTGRCCFPADCRSWQTGCRSCPHRTSYPPTLLSNCRSVHLLKTHLFEQLDSVTFVAPTRFVAQRVKESMLRYCPTVIIPDGVDTTIFHPGKPDSSPAPGSKKRLLAVARRWEPRKHPERVLALIPHLKDDEELTVVGMDRKMLPEHPGVVRLPLIDDAASLAALYRSADLLVNPSTDETYGMTVAEAIACGVPALIAPGGALAEMAVPLGAETVSWTDPAEVMQRARRLMASPPRLVTPPDTALMTASYLTLFDSLTR